MLASRIRNSAQSPETLAPAYTVEAFKLGCRKKGEQDAVDYLSIQFPNAEAGAHMTTANSAIASAQKDVVTAFVRHKAASN